MFNSSLPRASRGGIAPKSNTIAQMNTTFVSSARVSQMLESGRFFTLRGSYVVQGESHPESGEAFSVRFSVDRGGFAKVDGKPVKRYGLPTAKEVLKAALKALGELEDTSARLYCDDQDERFLASVGAISRASCDS
jgi:hypothetical protein